MSILSNSIYGSSTGKGVGGLLSGLDTDELVNQMTAITRNKINKQYQEKQKLLYRQEAYREISTKLLALSNKYFSYSSGSKTNILSANFFEAHTFESSSSYVNVTGNADSIKNFEINEIKTVASAASFASDYTVSSQKISSEVIPDEISRLAGESFSIRYNDKTYSVTVDKDFKGQTMDEVIAQLNNQLSSIKDEEGNPIGVQFSFTTDPGDSTKGKFTLSSGAYLSGASSEFLNVLKMKTGKENEENPTEFISKDEFKFTRSKEDILKSIDNEEYITFSYNGVSKNIKLSEKVEVPTAAGTGKEEIELNDVNSLKRYLQSELDKAYGAGKVSVEVEGDKLTFATTGADKTDVLKVNSISRDLSKLTRLESGDVNRVEKDIAIEETDLRLGLSRGTFTDEEGESFNGYELLVNGKSVIIKEGSSLNDIVRKINDETDIIVTYSETTDTFSAVSKETGEHRGVDITDKEGNLAQALFGTSVNSNLNEGDYLKAKSETDDTITYDVYDKDNNIVAATTVTYDKKTKKYSINGTEVEADYHINQGTDTEMTYTLNGVKNTVKRSNANFTIDDISIELNQNAEGLGVGGEDDTPAVTFDVTNNVDEVVERVKNFIDEYNEIINLIGTGTNQRPKRDYPPLTPEQQDEMKEEEIKNWTAEAKKGVLYSDPKMMRALSELRGAMGGTTDTSSLTLTSIGISPAFMDTTGKLVLDEDKFKQKLLEDPDEVANLFSGAANSEDDTPGIAVQLKEILVKNVGVSGTSGLLIEEAGMNNGLTADKNYISEKITDYDEKMEELKKALAAERQRYWNQFASLEKSLNQLNAQSSWLTNMMGN